MSKIVKKVSIWIGILVAIFIVISFVATMIIYNAQFPRYNRPDSTTTAMISYDEIAVDYPREEVTFLSGKTTLQGYSYYQEDAFGVVVVAHGIGGGADSYLPQIMYFLDQGWAVFAYDATGSYDSGGKTTRGFPQALLDLDAALTFLGTLEQFHTLPILLFGHSWGGYAAANILHYGHDVRGIVSVAAPNSPMDIVMEQTIQMMGVFGYTQQPFLWLYQRLLFGKATNYTALDAINHSEIPFYIIHGINDEAVLLPGSAIASNAVFFTNPNAIVEIIPTDNRNGHSDIFRSQQAMEYITLINVEYRELYDSHDGDIPYEEKQLFYAALNKALVQELDAVLMAKINTFFTECILPANDE